MFKVGKYEQRVEKNNARAHTNSLHNCIATFIFEAILISSVKL